MNKLNPAWLQNVDVQVYIARATFQVSLFITKISENIPSTYLHAHHGTTQYILQVVGKYVVHACTYSVHTS